MWLIIVALGATITTALWYSRAEKDDLLLKHLALMLWGATIMVFVDHLYSYLEGGEFIELSLEAVAIGLTMVLGAMLIWILELLIKDPRGVFRKGQVK